MNRRALAIGAAFILCAFMLLTMVPTNAAATPAPYVFIEEDVEEPTFEEWHVRWNKFDANDGSSWTTGAVRFTSIIPVSAPVTMPPGAPEAGTIPTTLPTGCIR